MNRRTTLMWLKELIEHMSECHQQLEWSAEGPSARFLTESLLSDLSQCRRLCERLRPAGHESTLRQAV